MAMPPVTVRTKAGGIGPFANGYGFGAGKQCLVISSVQTLLGNEWIFRVNQCGILPWELTSNSQSLIKQFPPYGDSFSPQGYTKPTYRFYLLKNCVNVFAV